MLLNFHFVHLLFLLSELLIVQPYLRQFDFRKFRKKLIINDKLSFNRNKLFFTHKLTSNGFGLKTRGGEDIILIKKNGLCRGLIALIPNLPLMINNNIKIDNILHINEIQKLLNNS